MIQNCEVLSMLKLLLGDPNARRLRRYQPIVSDINLLEEQISPLSDEELRGMTFNFSHDFRRLVV